RGTTTTLIEMVQERWTQGTPTFIFRSRFHEPRLIDGPPFPGAFNNGSTPASNVMAVMREASATLAKERMTASPDFRSARLNCGSFSIKDCKSFEAWSDELLA